MPHSRQAPFRGPRVRTTAPPNPLAPLPTPNPTPADSPLCQGLLTGKYNKDVRPTGPRAQLFTESRYQSVQVLLGAACSACRACMGG